MTTVSTRSPTAARSATWPRPACVGRLSGRLSVVVEQLSERTVPDASHGSKGAGQVLDGDVAVIQLPAAPGGETAHGGSGGRRIGGVLADGMPRAQRAGRSTEGLVHRCVRVVHRVQHLRDRGRLEAADVEERADRPGRRSWVAPQRPGWGRSARPGPQAPSRTQYLIVGTGAPVFWLGSPIRMLFALGFS